MWLLTFPLVHEFVSINIRGESPLYLTIPESPTPTPALLYIPPSDLASVSLAIGFLLTGDGYKGFSVQDQDVSLFGFANLTVTAIVI